MVSSYVLVSTDVTDKVIKAGPLLWNGVSALPLPANQQALTEAVALGQGYGYPTPSAASVNATTLIQRAAAALTANTTYLAIPAPSVAQATVQVGRLTRQVNALMRLQLAQTEDISNT